MSDTIAALAKRFWSIHPREIQDLGITREQFYEREMQALFTTLEARLDRAVTRGLEQVEHIATLEAALRRADQFITNGIELGYIRMPDTDLPDSAHQTPSIIRSAIAQSCQPKVLLPCPVCGGEAIHMIDTLKRIIILDDPEWSGK